MSTVTSQKAAMHAIGDMAGQIWQYLQSHGPTPISKVVREVGGSRDLVHEGIGWLAREEKIRIEENGRNKTVLLS